MVMKNYSVVALSAFLSILIFYSCAKDTVTKTVDHDTTIEHDTIAPVALSATQILIQKSPWEVLQSYYSISGANYTYYRGSSSNSFPAPGIDATRYSFYADSTGTYTDGYGITTGTTWQFTSLADTAILINIQGQTYDWGLISITDSTFFNTSYVPSQAIVSAVELVPVP
jgi:hypothetical protein